MASDPRERGNLDFGNDSENPGLPRHLWWLVMTHCVLYYTTRPTDPCKQWHTWMLSFDNFLQ